MDCPVCNEAMLVVEYMEVEVDLCEECGGVWFDRDELDYLLSTGGLSVNDLGLSVPAGHLLAKDPVRRCPLCKKSMKKFAIGPDGSVIVDRCEIHGGYWFDAGELNSALGDRTKGEAWKKAGGFIDSIFNEPCCEEETEN